MIIRAQFLVLALTCVACATATPMTIETLVTGGERDVVAMTHELRGKRLLLNGLVASKDLVPLTQVEAQENPWTRTVTASKVRLQVPLLVLGMPGRVNCYFDPEDLGVVAPVRVGDRVTLECTFIEYQGKPEARVPVLAACQLQT